ncbi:MAG TPA: CDP-diacylglycerol--glycerol-3-phosphate 3-phosphatidyltransferase [Parachlamydiales bacterium]|nr:MAG: hypothetical protein A3I15_04535 [Chlamydiae bacterium RIFCSPLOWO2_02_FULL_49_12]HAZ15893.1 CDP-diacylglycerol--glycerol-3-phosphate 3-phosphatidyltransferase [Parachlamydiales bacterium]HCJ83088.1 CDP-diacylglycerol--glycerol-3-phosphate 3-phosphatidyltransferase [Parachlamydiales bacterium]HCJ84083.1 CDP-diacylglycerol--glycerol-3-phosphate 3-phosphatidyltransferase [Parachlamydiales bacterium]
MVSISNSLTFLRAPLAFLFLAENPTYRLIAIVLAMMTDSIDGYLARLWRSTSRFGAILDPLMDKFFVLFALAVFLHEGRLELWQALAMISRDFFLCAFGMYLALSGQWHAFECQAIRWGKISTALQFFILFGLTLGYSFSWQFYALFILFGILAFVELCQLIKRRSLIPPLSRK